LKPPENREHSSIKWHCGTVLQEQRSALLGQRAATVWLTGLSGAGKSTLAYALEKQLIANGVTCFVLDGDNVRHGLNRDLGFSAAHRCENIRRIAEVAKLMNDAGMIVITATISPFRSDREMAREIIGKENFFEVHVATPLAVCEQRDVKGLYKRARSGGVPNFTGISAPYELPQNSALTLDSSLVSLDESVVRLMQILAPKFSGKLDGELK
jgi:adenylyl-sulfate kinase